MADATNKSIFARLDTSLMKSTKPLATPGNQEGVKQENKETRFPGNKETCYLSQSHLSTEPNGN